MVECAREIKKERREKEREREKEIEKERISYIKIKVY